MQSVVSKITTKIRRMKNQGTILEFLTFFRRASQLKANPRFGTSLPEFGDTVAEHSWRLALMTYLIGTEFKVGVDLNRAMAIALFHDLAEAKTGDIDAYEVIEKRVSVEEKHAQEAAAMDEMTNDLSFGHRVHDLWTEYLNQETIEARFVKALDKIEAFLHIDEQGVDGYKPKEFHSNYADEAVQRFDEAASHFPELSDLLEMVKKDLKIKFQEKGIEWRE